MPKEPTLEQVEAAKARADHLLAKVDLLEAQQKPLDDATIGQSAWNRISQSETRQCTAMSSTTGERCKSTPIVGGFVCMAHGGRAPQVRMAARDRLMAMVDPVLNAFETILHNWQNKTCPTCHNPTGDLGPIIRVGQLVLDRAGFHPTLNVNVQAQPNAFAGMSLSEIADKAMEIALLARQRADDEQKQIAAGNEHIHEAYINSIDGYLVPEDDAPPIEVSNPESNER